MTPIETPCSCSFFSISTMPSYGCVRFIMRSLYAVRKSLRHSSIIASVRFSSGMQRSTRRRTPLPTRCRVSSSSTAGKPRGTIAQLTLSHRSPSVLSSVPSKSKIAVFIFIVFAVLFLSVSGVCVIRAYRFS